MRNQEMILQLVKMAVKILLTIAEPMEDGYYRTKGGVRLKRQDDYRLQGVEDTTDPYPWIFTDDEEEEWLTWAETCERLNIGDFPLERIPETERSLYIVGNEPQWPEPGHNQAIETKRGAIYVAVRPENGGAPVWHWNDKNGVHTGNWIAAAQSMNPEDMPLKRMDA